MTCRKVNFHIIKNLIAFRRISFAAPCCLERKLTPLISSWGASGVQQSVCQFKCLRCFVQFEIVEQFKFVLYYDNIYLKRTMSGFDDSVEAEINAPGFAFDDWVNELGLKRSIAQELRKEELVTKEALSLVKYKDLKKLNFPLGVINVIMNSISKWKVKTDSMSIPADKGPALDVAAGNIGQLEGAGKTLDSLLNVIEAPVDSETDTKMNFGFMDP